MSAFNELKLGAGVAITGEDVSTHHFPVRDPGGKNENVDYSLRVHRSLESLEALEAGWRRLTPDDAPPFQTYSWNLAWYRNFASGDGVPLIFEARQGGVTVAVLPCYLEGRTIRLAGDQVCDCQDVIASGMAAVNTTLKLAMDWLRREAKRSHFHFEKLAADGLLFQALHDSADLPNGTLIFKKSGTASPAIDLKGGPGSYLASLPREARQDLGESLNRLRQEAPVARIMRLRDLQIRVDDLLNAAAFHIGHFRNDGGSPLRDERLIRLLGEIAKDPEVGFQLSCLTNQGDFLAVDFGFVRGGRYYRYLSASDEAFGRFDPGKCLLLKHISASVKEDGVHAPDRSAAGEPCQNGITGGSSSRIWSMRLMPRDLRNRARRLGLESGKQFRRFAKSALERAAILPR